MERLILIFLIAWFITRFGPIQDLIWFYKSKITNSFLRKNIKLFLIYIIKPLECIKCLTFWLTLILTGNLLNALAISFIANLYDTYVGKKENSIF